MRSKIHAELISNAVNTPQLLRKHVIRNNILPPRVLNFFPRLDNKADKEAKYLQPSLFRTAKNIPKALGGKKKEENVHTNRRKATTTLAKENAFFDMIYL